MSFMRSFFPENTSLWFPIRPDTNSAVHAQKMARSSKKIFQDVDQLQKFGCLMII